MVNMQMAHAKMFEKISIMLCHYFATLSHIYMKVAIHILLKI